MKIVFVEHPCPVLLHGDQPWSPVRTNTYPQSQLVLAASVSDQHDVEILDLRSLPSPTAWRQSIGPEYLAPIRYGQTTLTRHLISNSYREQIAAHPADMFVFTANFTSEANAVTEVMRAVKTTWPESLLLVGGSDASPQERHAFYFTAGADYIGTGDGDTALSAFLSEIQKGRRPKDRLIVGGIPRDYRLALPNLSLVPLQRYRESGGGPILPEVFRNGGFAAYTEISRGCSRECTFCGARRTPLWTAARDAMRHLDHLIDGGCELLMFSDDNLLLAYHTRQELLMEIFTYLRERQVAWEFPNGLEVGLLRDKGSGAFNEGLLRTLFWSKRGPGSFMGAHRLLVPLEDSLLHKSDLSKLGWIQTHIGELLQRLIDTGIPFLNLAIMIGNITEEPADRDRLESNLEILHQLTRSSTTRVNFSIFCESPLPGTPLGISMTDQSRLSHTIEEAPELWTVFASVINGNTFSAEQTTQYRRKLLDRFHMTQHAGKVEPPT